MRSPKQRKAALTSDGFLINTDLKSNWHRQERSPFLEHHPVSPLCSICLFCFRHSLPLFIEQYTPASFDLIRPSSNSSATRVKRHDCN